MDPSEWVDRMGGRLLGSTLNRALDGWTAGQLGSAQSPRGEGAAHLMELDIRGPSLVADAPTKATAGGARPRYGPMRAHESQIR